jgi:hypothetical protein
VHFAFVVCSPPAERPYSSPTSERAAESASGDTADMATNNSTDEAMVVSSHVIGDVPKFYHVIYKFCDFSAFCRVS